MRGPRLRLPLYPDAGGRARHGYHGRSLKVDLANGSTEVIHPPDGWPRDFVGGEGLGTNDRGLATISTGQVIATAMEWFETGVLGPEQTVGLDLTWGSKDAVLALIETIGRREGIGDLLAEGVQRAAAALGPRATGAATHVKGDRSLARSHCTASGCRLRLCGSV